MTAPARECQPDNEPLRFTIKWWRGVYSVSIAGYDGGEVVDAAAYDALQARVDELTKALQYYADGWNDRGKTAHSALSLEDRK